MDQPVTNAPWLLRRQMELENALRAGGRIRLAEEQELLVIGGRLSRYPEAVKAILEIAPHLHLPIDVLTEANIVRSA